MKQQQHPSGLLQPDSSIVKLLSDSSNLMNPPHRELPPNEILLLILSHFKADLHTLYQCTLVTKHFNFMATPLLWQKLNFDDKTICKRYLSCLSRVSKKRLVILAQYIRDLGFRGPSSTNTQFLRLIPHMPHLQQLSISPDTKITDANFQLLPQQCPNITSLNLLTNVLTRASFSAIGQHCHQLRDFQWGIMDDQSPDWLALLTPSCPLEKLKIMSSYLTLNETTISTIKSFDRLTSLSMSYWAPHGFNLLLTPQQPLWPRLTQLQLDSCDTVDDTTLVHFMQSHPHLQQLKLRMAVQLTDTTLDAINGLLDLTHIHLSHMGHITPDGVRRLLIQNHLPKLESIKLFYCCLDVVRRFCDYVHVECRGIELDQQDIEKFRRTNDDNNR